MNQKIWVKVAQNIKLSDQTLHSQYLLEKPNGNKRILHCYDNFILYGKVDQKPQKYLRLDYDTKFEINYKAQFKQNEDESDLGEITGITFIVDLNYSKNQASFLGEQQKLIELRDFLRQRINQWHFHHMFRVFKKIGKGSFATVYLAERISDSQQFAVKAFTKEIIFSEDNGKASIINEIKIMRALNSKHLMKLYEVYETQNSIYMVLELLYGGSLFDYIKDKKGLKIPHIQQIMAGILIGLDEMHNKEIMHRDLKLENILFKKKSSLDSVVIADFGLATNVNELEYLYSRCGTPGYVAPEIMNIKDLKAKYSSICDIYSVGLIFYILLSGRPAFPGKTYKQVVKQNREAKIDFAIKQLKNVPPDALNLLEKMLIKNPKQRINIKQCLNHPFLKDNIDLFLGQQENEDSDRDIDEFIDEGVDKCKIEKKIATHEFVFEASRNINSPSLSPDESPAFILKHITYKQKMIDSAKLLFGQSPLFKGRVDTLGSDTFENLSPQQLDRKSQHPSPILKQSKFAFAKPRANQSILKYVEKRNSP